MNGQHTDFFYRYRWVIVYGAMIAAMLSLGRAYATDDIHWALRTLMWSLVVGLILLQVIGIHRLAASLGFQYSVAMLVSFGVTTMLLAAELELLKTTPLLPKAHDPYFEFVVFLAPAVALVGGGALLIDRLARSAKRVSDAATKRDPAILTIQAQEHYLRITTREGVHMVRGNLRDKVADLSDVDGAQVHRSWWVARQAVVKAVRRNRDYVLYIESGETVPVSRSRVPQLRRQGWL